MDLEPFIKIGKECGLAGQELLQFARDERDKVVTEKRNDEQLARDERQQRRENDLKQKELDLKLAECKQDNVLSSGLRSSVPSMPALSESDDLDAYLMRFERHAKLAKWPKDCWAPALCNLLTGRALEVYSLLPVESAESYDDLKIALLRQFSVTEEGFRKRFKERKEATRRSGESFPQFAARISGYLDRWVELAGKEKKYAALSDLIVCEQLLEGCDKSLAVFIRERKPVDAQELAEIAQRYEEARGKGSGPMPESNERSSRSRGADHAPMRNRDPENRRQGCFKCGRRDHYAMSCPVRVQGDARSGRNANRFNQSRKTGGACVAENFPVANSTENAHVETEDAFHSGHLLHGHNLLVMNGGCTVGPGCRHVRVNWGQKKVKVLRDTGCNTVVVRRQLVEETQLTGESQSCILMDGTMRRVPIALIDVCTPYFRGQVKALCMNNPIYDVVIGNVPGATLPTEGDNLGRLEDTQPQTRRDTAGLEEDTARVSLERGACGHQSGETRASDEDVMRMNSSSRSYGASIETRGMRRQKDRPWKPLRTANVFENVASKEEIAKEQMQDETLDKLRQLAQSGEIRCTGQGNEIRYFFRNHILFREYRSPHIKGGKIFTQLVVPVGRRETVLQLAHDSPMAGHLRRKKTLDRIQAQFYWPGIQAYVKRYCASCDSCQRTTPKGRIGKVPLVNPPLIDTCFRRVAVDLIGPLDPVTERGNRYILTIVDLATRYPEAIALPRIEAERVAEALVEVFSRLGVPSEMLSDNGSQFVSGVMKEVARILGVRQLYTTPYHPMANGACERFNGTLKQMLRRMCQERPADWDRYLPALLFAYREVPHEATGYSPFELMYGRTVRGPMSILKELWAEEIPEEEVKTTYQYVLDLKQRLEETCEAARNQLAKSSRRYKKYFDVKARERRFEVGDMALLLLPTTANKLKMQWKGPFQIVRKVARHDYRMHVNGKEKTYHANLLKKYVSRSTPEPMVPHEDTSSEEPIAEAQHLTVIDDHTSDDGSVEIVLPTIESSEGVDDVEIDPNLEEERREELLSLLYEYNDVLTDIPGKTDLIEYDIRLTTEVPVRSKPYPVPHARKETIRQEVETMLRMGVIEETTSPYASPVVLVVKKDGKNRFCVDYRRLNTVTVADK